MYTEKPHNSGHKSNEKSYYSAYSLSPYMPILFSFYISNNQYWQGQMTMQGHMKSIIAKFYCTVKPCRNGKNYILIKRKKKTLYINYLRKKSPYGGYGSYLGFPSCKFQKLGVKMRASFCSFDLAQQQGPDYYEFCVNSSERKGSQLERAT